MIREEKDKEFKKLVNDILSLSKLSTIISSAYQYKCTEDIIANKTLKEENVIIFGINDINSKVLTNTKKFENINKSKNDILNDYKTSLEKLGESYDNIITMNYMKLLEEDLEQLEKYIDIYKLRKKEITAKSKLDNSDDEIAEEIYKIEDELSKIEAKSRRTKTTVNTKIKEKNTSLMDAMEAPEKEIQVKIKGPQIFRGAKKFFFGKINPQKMIEKNVFLGIRERIDKFNNEDLSDVKKNDKYTKENLINSVNSIMQKKYKKILSSCD